MKEINEKSLQLTKLIFVTGRTFKLNQSIVLQKNKTYRKWIGLAQWGDEGGRKTNNVITMQQTAKV